MNPLQNYRDASIIMSTLLDQLTADAMSNATPCKDWTVAELVNHVIDNSYFFAGAAGAPPATAASSLVDPASAAERYQLATEAVLAAYGSDGTLDRDLITPFGTFPGAMVLSVAFADQLTHCWDLAYALGTSVSAPEELAGHALAAWQAFIQADYRNGEMFGEAAAVSADASALDRVAAFTGRNVS